MTTFEVRPWGGILVHSIVPAAITCFIFVGGSAKPAPGGFQVNDKVAHAIVFCALALSTGPLAGHWLMHWPGPGRLGRACTAAGAYSVVVGGALELWQSRLPHRSADVWDWAADTLGALVATLLLFALVPRYTKWRRQVSG